MRPISRALSTVVVVGGLLAGCGGDEDVQEALLDADDDDAGLTVDIDDDDDGPGLPVIVDDDEDDFCGEAEELQQRFANLDSATTPDSELFAETSDAFSDLADDAPPEIRDDMGNLAGALAALADVFDGADLNDPDARAEIQERIADLEGETADLDEAADNVEAYFREECDVDLTDLETETETEVTTETETNTETETDS